MYAGRLERLPDGGEGIAPGCRVIVVECPAFGQSEVLAVGTVGTLLSLGPRGIVRVLPDTNDPTARRCFGNHGAVPIYAGRLRRLPPA